MKLWVISASTGGGHDMRAFALRDWWHKRGGVCEVYHPLESSFMGYRVGCQLYNFIQRKLPLLHHGYFHFLELASMHKKPHLIIGSKKFLTAYNNFSPQVIVSTHAHLNHGYFELARNNSVSFPRFVVYCGELADGVGFSKHWVNEKVDLFVSPYKEGCIAAENRGMPLSKCLVAGPLLREPFYKESQPFDKKKILNKYNLDSTLPIFLLGTGANGVNHHLSIIRAINKAQIKCQIIALCGRDHETFNKVKKLSSFVSLKIIPLPVVGASQMVDLLRVATFMIARPGAGLTTEAIVTGCPMIFDLSGGCMPQESNNLNFWRSRTGSIVSFYSVSKLIKIIQSNQQIPRLKIPLNDSPSLLLNNLSILAR